MNVDVENVTNGMKPLHEYGATLISIGVALGLLYTQVGTIFMAPLILTVILVTITIVNGTSVAPKQKAWLSATQTRVSYITEVVSAMKNIKLLGVGSTVLETGNDLREKEVAAQRRIHRSLMITYLISQTTFQLASLALFSAHAIRTHFGGEPLTSIRLFASLSILKLFTSPMLSTVQWMPQTLQSFAALQRIQVYLSCNDHMDERHFNLEGQAIMSQKQPMPSSLAVEQIMVQIKNVTCGYAAHQARLIDVNCDFYRQQFTIVTGK